MVKFSFFALAGAIATASAAPVKKTIKLGNRALRRGDPATEALLKNAKPYKKAGTSRKLANDDANEFEIDSTYSLKFEQCLDVKTSNDDLFDENIVSYVQAGQVVATKSYVLFHVCQGDNCFYESDEDLYMVDLATYLGNVANYYATKEMEFCNQCERFQDYCVPEEEEAEEEEEAADEEAADEEEAEGEDEAEEGEGEGEGEGRKLNKKQRRAKNYIDCDQCIAMNCYEDEDNLDDGQQSQQEMQRDIAEFVEQISECQETASYLGDNQLFVGPICSPYGDGVELAVFLDDECSMYTTLKSFSDVELQMDENANANVDYMSYAEDYIKTAFKETLSCENVEYDDPEEDDDGNREEEYEPSEACKRIMEEGAVDYNNCQGGNAEEEQADDDATSWYQYDISARNAEDLDEVCYTIQKMEGEFYHAYDETASGSWYTRNKKGKILYGDEPKGLSGGAIFGIVLLCLAVVGGAAFVLVKKQKSAGATASENYQGGTLS